MKTSLNQFLGRSDCRQSMLLGLVITRGLLQKTAKELTEEQVFQPMRESYDWRINSLLGNMNSSMLKYF